MYALYADPDADFTSWPLNKAVWKRSFRLTTVIPERTAGACGGCATSAGLGREIANLSGGERRRVALCRLLLKNQTCCCSTNRPTTWMPNPCLAGTLPARLRGHRGGDYPRRYFLDNVAGWILELDRGEGIRGKATTPPGWSRKISAWRRNFTRSGAS